MYSSETSGGIEPSTSEKLIRVLFFVVSPIITTTTTTMSFTYAMRNMTKHLTSENGDMGCTTCTDFGPDTVADPGLPALKPNVAIIIIGLGFTLILVAAFALFAKFMRPHLSRQDAGTRMWEDVVKDGHLLDTNVIKNLPLVIYSSESFNGMNLDSECAVCLSSFEEKEELRLLPNCKHMFHPSCIDNWLRSHPSCPLCRSTIISSSWTLRNPPAGPPEPGAVALSIFVSSQGAGPSSGPGIIQRSSSMGEISGSSRRDDDSSHRIEITVIQDQHQQQQQHHTSPADVPCMRAASWCGGTMVAPRKSKEFRKDICEQQSPAGAGGGGGGGGSSSSAVQQTQRGADVHEFDPYQNAGQANQSAQSVFIFIPQAPITETSATGAGAGSGGVFSENSRKPTVVLPEGRSAISKLHEEVRSSLEASGSLRKFGNSTLQGVFGSSPIRDTSSLQGGSTTGQGQGGDGGSPSSQDHQSIQARHCPCTGEKEDRP